MSTMRHYQFVTILHLATSIFLVSINRLIMCHIEFSSSQNQRQCPTLHLLNVQPYPDESANSWDKAFEMIPAGHLAAEQINNRSDILSGYNLKLINIDSEACGINVITKGVINIYQELMNPNQPCIAGVIGLFCSPVTKVISPIISHPKIGGYVHIAASASPVYRENGNSDSRLFHIIGSSSVLNEAALALMHTYNWKRIISVHAESHLYFRSTSDNFIERVFSNSEYMLLAHIDISEQLHTENIIETFSIINSVGGRISYWSVTNNQAAHHLCKAFQMNFTWPGYVYIIQQLEDSIDRILKTETPCSREELLIAMEGIFIVDYRLYVKNDTRLVSGVSYSEFQQLYIEKLKYFANNVNKPLKSDVYANSLYDQVWAFALAINNSLESVESQNLSFVEYGIGKNVPTLSNILQNELGKVSFQGASGWIDFSKNQESSSFVDIFQVQKGNLTLIGVYDPYSHNVTLTEAAPRVSDVPPDTFDTVYQLLPHWLEACMLVAQVLLFGLITMNLFFVLKWKNEKNIKAISPLLSSLMMLGCYSLCITPVSLMARRMLFSSNTAVVKSLCYLETWTWMGTDLILAILFLKLLRVYHIFRTFHKTSRYWSDQYLFIYTLAICGGKAMLVVLWNSTNSLYIKIHKVYVNRPDKLPYYVATVWCNTPVAWLVATGLYSGVLLFLVVILAVATRHIKKDNFKDTKKVNTFIFLVAIVIVTNISLLVFFHDVGIQTGADIAKWLPSFAIPMLCQVCLFTPKILPLALKKVKFSEGD